MTHSQEEDLSSDELMERLARLDPTRSDVSPAAGSSRFTSIKDGIMDVDEARPTSQPSTRQPTNRRYILAAVAAVVAVLMLGATVFAPSATPSAEATVLAAVQNSAELTDFRMDMVSSDTDFFGGSLTIEVDGANAHVSGGGVEGYVIDGTSWLSEDGGQTFEVSQNTPIPSYSQGSAAVITAALESGDVTDRGQQTVRGTETTLYEVVIDDEAAAALSELSREETFWFVETTQEECTVVEEGGETIESCERRSGFLEDAESISIWVADDLVHQIAVDSGSVQFTHTIYDLGADITITAPE